MHERVYQRKKMVRGLSEMLTNVGETRSNKLTVADSFRIGCIGRLGADQVRGALAAIKETLTAMGVETCTPAAA